LHSNKDIINATQDRIFSEVPIKMKANYNHFYKKMPDPWYYTHVTVYEVEISESGSCEDPEEKKRQI